MQRKDNCFVFGKVVLNLCKNAHAGNLKRSSTATLFISLRDRGFVMIEYREMALFSSLNNDSTVFYFLLSNVARILLTKLRKFHADDPQLAVFSRDYIGEEIFAAGVYERNEITAIIDSFQFETRDHVCLDIGANIGNHSVQFASRFKEVLSFEPNKKVYELLTINTRSFDNVTIYNFGLSDKTEESYFVQKEGNLGGSFIESTNKRGDGKKIELRRYDDHFSKEVSFIKLDVEGFEIPVLKGMGQSIAKYGPVIAFELNNHEGQKSDLIETIKGFGYDKFYIPKKRNSYRDYSNKAIRLIILLRNALESEHGVKGLKKVERFDKRTYNLVIACRTDSPFQVS